MLNGIFTTFGVYKELNTDSTTSGGYSLQRILQIHHDLDAFDFEPSAKEEKQLVCENSNAPPPQPDPHHHHNPPQPAKPNLNLQSSSHPSLLQSSRCWGSLPKAVSLLHKTHPDIELVRKKTGWNQEVQEYHQADQEKTFLLGTSDQTKKEKTAQKLSQAFAFPERRSRTGAEYVLEEPQVQQCSLMWSLISWPLGLVHVTQIKVI